MIHYNLLTFDPCNLFIYTVYPNLDLVFDSLASDKSPIDNNSAQLEVTPRGVRIKKTNKSFADAISIHRHLFAISRVV